MPRYADDSKEKVRAAVDFFDLVGRYTDLRRAGPGQMTGLCPFHEEHTPSFRVHEEFFKCFGCGEGGDVFAFVMKKEGLDFPGALEWLADRYGVELEVAEEDPQAAAKRKARSRLLEVLERTATFYSRVLWESAEAAAARDYLRQRGLEDAMLREFRVGYAPSAWDKVLLASRRAGWSEQELYDAGLVQRNAKTGRVYDRFRGRIMFPLCDRRGKVLGFGARRMGEGDGPKYLNSPDGAVYHKGLHVYAADIARVHAARAGEVILCEGYTDVIALHQAGMRNAVGLMGTALTGDQVAELSRLAPVVLLALDSDNAGQEAMLKAAKVAEGRGVELRVVPLPPGDDPADVVQREGGPIMRSLLERSVPFVRFRVDRALAGADLSRAEGKDRAVHELAPILREVPPSALREELMRVISDRLDLDRALLDQMLGRPSQSARPAPPRPSPARPSPTPAASSSSPFGDDGWPAESDAPIFDADADPQAGAVPTAALDSLARAERGFLAACVAVPTAGAQLLSELDLDAELSVPLHRRAAAHLRAHAESPAAGVAQGDELAPLVAELVIRAEDHHATRATLDAELAKLRLAALERGIQKASMTGDTTTVAELASRRAALKRAVDDAIARALDEAEA